jgi:hypothetical protein
LVVEVGGSGGHDLHRGSGLDGKERKSCSEAIHREGCASDENRGDYKAAGTEPGSGKSGNDYDASSKKARIAAENPHSQRAETGTVPVGKAAE